MCSSLVAQRIGGPGAVVKAVSLENQKSRLPFALWHSSFKETKCFFSLTQDSILWGASDRQGSNFKFCVWRAVSSHHPQKVLLAQFKICAQRWPKISFTHLVAQKVTNYIWGAFLNVLNIFNWICYLHNVCNILFDIFESSVFSSCSRLQAISV